MDQIKHWWHRAKWIRRKSFIIPTVVALILGGGYYFVWGKGAAPEIVAADNGSVVETVVISGKTKAGSAVDLAFEKSGQVAKVTAQVGDTVKANQVIVALEAGELNAQFLEAKANLAAEQIKLTELQKGTRSEELSVYDSKVSDANSALQDASQTLKQRTREAYTLADDAIHNLSDQVLINPRSSSVDIIVPVSNGNLRTDVLVSRYALETLFNDWATKLEDSKLAASNLLVVKDYLDKLALIVNSAGVSDTTFNTYKSNIYTARTNLNTAITNLTAASEKFTSAGSALDVAQKELALKQAGNTPEEIAAQAARVDQVQAQLLNIGAQLKKTLLVSPIDGIVTKQDAKVGEIAASNVNLVSINSSGDLEVEAFVPEVHIGRLQVGNSVSLTLEALKGETFNGQVSHIDPDATPVSGVPNYKIDVVLNSHDDRLKTGLTADLKVETARRDNVVRLPRFALIKKDNLYLVNKVSSGAGVLTPVNVGLLGTDGMAEIISGLTAGEQVIVSK